MDVEAKELIKDDLIQEFESLKNDPILVKKETKPLNKRIKCNRPHPYPLLQEIIEMKTSQKVEFNEVMSKFGLQVKVKRGESKVYKQNIDEYYKNEEEKEDFGPRVLKALGKVTKGNKYLKKQYRRFENYRAKELMDKYINLLFFLISKSIVFKLAHLSKWQKHWYKDKKLSKNIIKMFNWTEDFLTNWNEKLDGEILRSKWIESPKGKFRQLCIPSLSVRFICNILNNALQHILRPLLPDKKYGFHGFIYDRGCLSAWIQILKEELWGWNNITQVDVASGFPNLSIKTVREALEYEKLNLPQNFVNLIMEFLVIEAPNSDEFPTYESKWESDNNKAWREGSRNVPMGLPISPILYTWTSYYVLIEKLGFKKYVRYVNYADDLNFFYANSFCNVVEKESNFEPVKYKGKKQTNLVHSLNEIPLMIEAGFQFEPKKTKHVKMNGQFGSNLDLLGMSLDIKNEQISSKTRGRGESPKRRSTLPQTARLESLSSKGKLDWKWLTKNYDFLGYLQGKLWDPASGDPEQVQKWKMASRKKLYSGSTLMGKFKKLKILPKRVTLQNAKFYSERVMDKIMATRGQIKSKPNLIPVSKDNRIILSERLRAKLNVNSPTNPRSDYFQKYHVDKDMKRVYAAYHS